MLRYVSETEATVWVETDGACEVEILGRTSRTFCVAGHHFAIVVIDGLEAGTREPYEVRLDGTPRWPAPGALPSLIRTPRPDERLDIVFGSCRVAVPHSKPYTLSRDDHDDGREVDALFALATRMRDQDPDEWPDLLLMLGDQVYVDEDAPETRAKIRAKRDTEGEPGAGPIDFEEYAWLYQESWGDPTIRWLLSNLPTAAIFDDHDVHDDWNSSAAWVEEMAEKPWWRERLRAALSSYWVYQDLGNRSPAQLAGSEILAAVRASADGREILRDWADRQNGTDSGRRFSHSRLLGRTKVIVLDAREGRQLEEGDRRMFDDDEWQWLHEEVAGDFDHLVIANTLPVLMSPAFHHLEAANEAICAGAWGPLGKAIAGERLRRALDLEHWGAFGHGFLKFVGLLERVGRGEYGPPPETITLLGGDVHHAYLAEVGFPKGSGVKSKVFQGVCSPFRNPLDRRERAVVRLGASRGVVPLARALARAAGVEDPPIRWRLPESPTFDNQVGTLTLQGRRARMRIERTHAGDDDSRLTTSLDRILS